MKKKYTYFIILLVSLTLLFDTAAGSSVMPYADSVFVSSGVSLSRTIGAVYAATTKSKCSVIKVSSCTLQVKSGNDWSDSTSLTAPSTVAKNTTSFRATGSYSSSCTSGNTYRIKATFDADGHQITKYSNEVTN